MKIWIHIWVLVLLVSLKGYSQLNFADIGGAHFKGLGRAGITLGGIGSLYYNQAGLHTIDHWAADVSFERKFNLEDLNSVQIGAAKKFGFGAVGILFSQFGNAEYNEQIYGIAYGRQVSKVVSIGGLLAMAGYNSQQFGSGYAPVIGLGGTISISKEFTVGAHIFNPLQLNIADNTETSARYRMGLSYQPSDKVRLLGEIDKDVARDAWEYKLGISYQMIERLSIQAGFNPSAEFFAFGISYNPIKTIAFKGAGSVHQVLGFSPAVSVSYSE